uniref:RING-type domain-containing protein n=1 Tax=Hyaloperonospora arabidopsidis (strain Emoy2) TaxID=559515 RepID=M4BBV3_HYAAE
MTTECPHYGRRCFVLAECCDNWVGCRLCHDKQLGSHHLIDRFAIEWMRCNVCQTEQPVCLFYVASRGTCWLTTCFFLHLMCATQKCAQVCVACCTTMAAYFCPVCHLFDDKGREKQIFHCSQCGICRVGGRENYYHCVTCCGCYPHSIRTKHRCVEASMHHDCPICLEVMFDSLDTVNVLPCGHVLHSKCHDQYVKHG